MSYVNCIHVCLRKAEGADEFSKLSYAQMGNDLLVQGSPLSLIIPHMINEGFFATVWLQTNFLLNLKQQNFLVYLHDNQISLIKDDLFI